MLIERDKLIKTDEAAKIISQDFLLLTLGLVVGFITPFMVWLWLVNYLSQVVLAKMA